jgi:hypothetical protein
MKRATILLTVLVLLFSLILVSCEAMFTTNIFGKLTHPKPSVADMLDKSPAEMQDYISSTENMNQLAEDSDLKDAALANMAAVYGGGATTSNQQTAAIVAAEISIRTVPDASGLSASILGALANGSQMSSDTEDDFISFVNSVLPADIADSVAPGADMPASFSDMIEAYLQANMAYQALGVGVGAVGYTADVSSAEMADIAVNAVIAGLISSVDPPSHNNADTAAVLWEALTGTAPVFTIDPDTLEDLTSTGSSIANLVLASSLGSMFD